MAHFTPEFVELCKAFLDKSCPTNLWEKKFSQYMAGDFPDALYEIARDRGISIYQSENDPLLPKATFMESPDNLNRHGTNAHSELPSCPQCELWNWRPGGVWMGGFTQCNYTCDTVNCWTAAFVLFRSCAFAVICARPPEAGSFKVNDDIGAWLNSCLAALGAADSNDCVWGYKTPPAHIQPTVGAPESALETLIQGEGYDTWISVDPGEIVDFAPAFSRHVARCIKNAKERGEL